MANICKTCRHTEAAQINEAFALGLSLRKIMDDFDGLSQGGLQRHKDNCLKGLFIEVREDKRKGLLGIIDVIWKEIANVRDEFGDNGQVRVQLIGKMLDAMDKEAKLTGAYQVPANNRNDLDVARLAVMKFVESYPNASSADRENWISWAAEGSGVDRAALVKHIKVQQLTDKLE